ncbi:MAG: cupin domain-containing protein [Victivallaceae bacterium]|nr:cupin domain-containing protein [Victivallaceae bacterium]
MEINKKLKELRLAKALTLDNLASITGLSKGYLSKIERSSAPPPFSTLETIARGLEENVSDFFEKPAAKQSRNIDIVKKSVRDSFIRSGAGYSYRTLVNSSRNKYMSPFLIEIPSGETGNLKHDGEEFVYVISGELELIYEGESYQLSGGDCFYLDSRIKHKFINRSQTGVKLLAVNYNYRRF